MAKLLALLFFLTVQFSLGAQYYPVIENLNEKDINFKQLITEINENNRLLATQQPLLPLMFYGYTSKPGDTLYKLAARFNLNYDSLASLNGLSSPLLFNEGDTLFIPNINGLALRNDEQDTFLLHLNQYFTKDNFLQATLYLNQHKSISVKFLPNAKFNANERLVFLQGFFRSPLNGQLMVTSTFGNRSNPFNHQAAHHHNGLDYRASVGTPVYAARGGIVSAIQTNNVLGLHLIINHENSYQTVYGHLSQTLFKPGEKVKLGAIIAKSGNSGQSTGPHLHFEIHKNGVAINPSSLIKEAD